MPWTLQSLIDGDMNVTAYCQSSPCHHSRRLDLVSLRDRFGPDWPAMHDDLAPKMKCAKCGGRHVGLIYSPAGNEKMVPKNPYKLARDGR